MHYVDLCGVTKLRAILFNMKLSRHTEQHIHNQNLPDHNSLQQLGLSCSLLVSASPGHFVWSHQWHQICTPERQPLVGGRQGRGQQQWPGWTLFLQSLLACTLTICYSSYCNQSSRLTVRRAVVTFISALIYAISWPWDLYIWTLIGGGHTHMLYYWKFLQTCYCDSDFWTKSTSLTLIYLC